ncbi:conserved hypothetical protein [Candidatus Zixiibacteriota bacterium]|nr:conserved hypothetical protein [candidate division Zixibacteria bacterium]
MYLTKTDFIEYLQCSKCLWLKKKRPDLYIAPVPTDFEESKIEEGQEVELLAHSLFPNGTLVSSELEQSLLETKRLIDSHTSPIFQATTVSNNNCLARIDILRFNADTDKWDIYEVKSSTEVKTDRSHNHIKDVTFQKLVLEQSGVSVDRTFIVHLNKEYRRAGKLNVKELLKIHDVSEDVQKAADNTAAEMLEALTLLNKDQIDLVFCDCLYLTRGNHCSSFGVFNPDVPDYSVHDILRIRPEKIKTIIQSGIVKIEDVSDSFKLTDIQNNQVQVARSQKPQIDHDAIKKLLDSLSYPLYFLDYETYCAAIPILDGYGPYQHIPFQVSIHKLHKDGTLQHYEYLGTSIADVPGNLLEYLKGIDCSGGKVVSWHASFENTRNKEMAELNPLHAQMLLDLNARTFDLETVFKESYLHPGFKGGTSIKKVLPALLPQFSYKDLSIQGGTEAMENWRKLIFDDLDESQKESIKKALLDYCCMDTLAMVEIFRHLQAYVS